jgi:hypothetical protein
MSNTRVLRERVTEGISRAAAMLKQMCGILAAMRVVHAKSVGLRLS